jgi:thiamine-phosphate pyrophosphorylase
MRARYPLPHIWLLTDERQGDALWTALRRLPRGSGVIVRHYSFGDAERRKIFDRIRGIARSRGLTLLLAAPPLQARQWRAHGSYGRPDGGGRFNAQCSSVHDLREIRRAEKSSAAMLLLSPLFPTRSHPGAPALGLYRFRHLVRATRLPVIALGGVQRRHEAMLRKIGAHGWAGIDAFIPKTRRKAIRT